MTQEETVTITIKQYKAKRKFKPPKKKTGRKKKAIATVKHDVDQLTKELGVLAKEKRLSKHKTIYFLSRKTKVPFNSIKNFEEGLRDTSLSIVLKIIYALDMAQDFHNKIVDFAKIKTITIKRPNKDDTLGDNTD